MIQEITRKLTERFGELYCEYAGRNMYKFYSKIDERLVAVYNSRTDKLTLTNY